MHHFTCQIQLFDKTQNIQTLTHFSIFKSFLFIQTIIPWTSIRVPRHIVLPTFQLMIIAQLPMPTSILLLLSSLWKKLYFLWRFLSQNSEARQSGIKKWEPENDSLLSHHPFQNWISILRKVVYRNFLKKLTISFFPWKRQKTFLCLLNEKW